MSEPAKNEAALSKLTVFFTDARIKKKPFYQAILAKPGKVQNDPDALYKLHTRWFFDLSNKEFRQLTQDYNETKLDIKIKKQKSYDEWLNYFKTLSPNTIRQLATTGQDFLPTEAYAALSRWHDIIGNPHRIDKIHQAGLTKPKDDKDGKTVLELAHSNDRLGVLKATRDKIAEKLDKGAGSRDTALLTREMTEIMTQIADYEKRLGPKKDTKLGKLLDDVDDVRANRPTYHGGGSRKTSFKSRVTIEDVEG